MDVATQEMKIISYCKKHGSITAREAFIKLNINSPRKCISNLRKSGKFIVNSVNESKTDADGNKMWWKRYFINELPTN